MRVSKRTLFFSLIFHRAAHTVVSFIGRKRIKYGSPLYKRDPSLGQKREEEEVATVKITSELTG